MAWRELAFIHYPVAAATLRGMLPAGLRLDEYDGTAWLGVVPFRMVQVTPRFTPTLPVGTTFPEVNVRTYVVADGKPGVWFFSLDADSWPTVVAGRRFFALPYHLARMQLHRRDGWHHCVSDRLAGGARFRARYRPLGDIELAAPGTFALWATERYCLYSHSPRLGLSRAEVHHAPWPLQDAEVDLEDNTLLRAAGLAADDRAPVCHFSPGVEVVAYGRESL